MNKRIIKLVAIILLIIMFIINIYPIVSVAATKVPVQIQFRVKVEDEDGNPVKDVKLNYQLIADGNTENGEDKIDGTEVTQEDGYATINHNFDIEQFEYVDWKRRDRN